MKKKDILNIHKKEINELIKIGISTRALTRYLNNKILSKYNVTITSQYLNIYIKNLHQK